MPNGSDTFSQDFYHRINSLSLLAANSGCWNAVRSLITDCGADINACDNDGNNDGNTVLLLAAKSDNRDMVSWLIENGAQDLPNNNGETISLVAARYGACEVLDLLDELCIVSAGDKNNNGDTPLILAARCGQRNAVAWFARCAGASSEDSADSEDPISLNERNNNGETPLMAAADAGHIDVVRYLLNRRPDFRTFMPIFLATPANVRRIEECQVADLFAVNRNGDDAVMLALKAGHMQVVSLLINSGEFDVNRTNNAGESIGSLLFIAQCGMLMVTTMTIMAPAMGAILESIEQQEIARQEGLRRFGELGSSLLDSNVPLSLPPLSQANFFSLQASSSQSSSSSTLPLQRQRKTPTDDEEDKSKNPQKRPRPNP